MSCLLETAPTWRTYLWVSIVFRDSEDTNFMELCQYGIHHIRYLSQKVTIWHAWYHLFTECSENIKLGHIFPEPFLIKRHPAACCDGLPCPQIYRACLSALLAVKASPTELFDHHLYNEWHDLHAWAKRLPTKMLFWEAPEKQRLRWLVPMQRRMKATSEPETRTATEAAHQTPTTKCWACSTNSYNIITCNQALV